MAGEGRVTGQVWRWTVLASMASYIDAGSIVAGASGLALWKSELHLSSAIVGGCWRRSARTRSRPRSGR